MKIRRIMAAIAAGVMCTTAITGCASQNVQEASDKQNSGDTVKEVEPLETEDIVKALNEFKTGSYAVDLNFSEATFGTFAVSMDGLVDNEQDIFMTINLDYEVNDALDESASISDTMPKSIKDLTLIEFKVIEDKIYINLPKFIELLNKLNATDSMGMDISTLIGDAEWLEITKDEATEIAASSGSVSSDTNVEEELKNIESETNKAVESILPIVKKMVKDIFGDISKDLVKADAKSISATITKDNLPTIIDALITGFENGTVDNALTEIISKCKELSLPEDVTVSLDELGESYTESSKEEILNNLKKLKDVITYLQKADLTAKATVDSNKTAFAIDGALIVDKKDLPDTTVEEGEMSKLDIVIGMNVELENKEVSVEAPNDKTTTMTELQEAINEQRGSMNDYDSYYEDFPDADIQVNDEF